MPPTYGALHEALSILGYGDPSAEIKVELTKRLETALELCE